MSYSQSYFLSYIRHQTSVVCINCWLTSKPYMHWYSTVLASFETGFHGFKKYIYYFICKMTTVNFGMFNCLSQWFPESKWCPTYISFKTGNFEIGKLLSINLRRLKLLMDLLQNTSHFTGVWYLDIPQIYITMFPTKLPMKQKIAHVNVIKTLFSRS